MRAVVCTELGPPEVLRVEERERPVPLASEVLVRQHMAGINPVDWKVRRRGGLLGDPPFVLGWDVAGVVEEAGPEVARLAPGDRVFGMPRFPGEAAAYAEWVTAPAEQLTLIPAGLDLPGAAALPLAGLTAWQALVGKAGLEQGQTVLVHAAAGGVGHLAVQIAKARGARVIGTAREDKHAFLAELGADEVVDYTRERFEDRVRDADVVLDLVGGEYAERSLACLRPGGLLIVVPSAARDVEAEAERAGVRTTRILVEPDHAGLEALAGLVESGHLRVEVADVLPLAEVARAHERGEQGRLRGKLVLACA